MYTGQIDTITNREDWTAPFFVQLIDDTDNSVINILNEDIGFDCSVYIKDLDGCQRATGSISDGKVIASSGDDGPGVEWAFEASDFSGLCSGTYQFGIKTTINGEVQDLLVGSLAVLRGN